MREYGDSLCCPGTVKAANALHLSPLPSAALGAWGRGKCSVRLPSTEILHKLTPDGITCMVLARNVCSSSTVSSPIDQLSVLGFGTI